VKLSWNILGFTVAQGEGGEDAAPESTRLVAARWQSLTEPRV